MTQNHFYYLLWEVHGARCCLQTRVRKDKIFVFHSSADKHQWMEQNIINSSCADAKTIIIEPFYGGSHKQMIQLLTTIWFDDTQYALFTTPAKKWKW